ncbi:hypothetical protein [Streptomyces sp. TRM70350]|uniref:hypothetical protein n=1 Tax=Streptomyces sp. TRM70350 TaxID=2856165 RepID=UPI001C476331|nr:hypothetical protein [Streptomyces sp. TRM70350]MBV7697297.1 hypothetical protein [Streptomyces sp. TRM70350]
MPGHQRRHFPATLPDSDRYSYSYSYDGNSQALDHLLISPAWSPPATPSTPSTPTASSQSGPPTTTRRSRA